MELKGRIILRNDTTQNWEKNSSMILNKGEPAIEVTNHGFLLRIGDGTNTFFNLTPINEFKHISELISQEEGVHGIRYYDQNLQVKINDVWETVNPGGVLGAQLDVTVPTGSIVTCTNGTETLTETSENNKVSFTIPSYGNWTIQGTLNGKKTNSKVIYIDTMKLYTAEIYYFEAFLDVSSIIGAKITVKNNNGEQAIEATSSTTRFTLDESGTYTVFATYNGVVSNTTNLEITENGQTYTHEVKFITLKIIINSGSSVTVSKDSITKQEVVPENGYVIFYLPSIGTWNITCILSGQSVTDTIDITDYNAYEKELAYFKYYGVKIQINNSNPETAVTYIEDATGMSSGHNSWKDTSIFKNIRPCLLKNGVVQYYLNPDNLAQKEDGTAATITDINAGDVMIEIPKIGYKMTTDGTYHYIYVTDNPNADGYCYRAHSLDSEGDCDKIYIGAYLGFNSSSKLYSISGKNPTVSTTLTNFRTYAQARGIGYQLISFYPLTLLQCLYLIKYKNRNSQAALGHGYVGGSAKQNTGATNTKGTDYGNKSSKTDRMCFLNIEDFWGNLFQWIDGIYCDSSRAIKTTYKNFNDNGSNYLYSKASGVSSNISNYLSDIQGTNEGGFVAKKVDGSSSTYYSDYASLAAGGCAWFGGRWNYDAAAGAFLLDVSYAASGSVSGLGARLLYKHKSS